VYACVCVCWERGKEGRKGRGQVAIRVKCNPDCVFPNLLTKKLILDGKTNSIPFYINVILLKIAVFFLNSHWYFFSIENKCVSVTSQNPKVYPLESIMPDTSHKISA